MSEAPSFLIRPLAGHAEYLACRALQRQVWGEDFTEAVSPALLWVAQRTGGLASGAFTGGGELAGFVFGITGYRDGAPVHWSDMLAVAPEWRGRGLGRALKLHQRELLLAAGVALVQWTFEPLESRNAWLNFRRLGITAGEYLRDVYGGGDSDLHRGLGTDRLVADWRIAGERVRSRLAGRAPEPAGGVAVVNEIGWRDEWPASGQPHLGLDEPRLLLRIPADIQSLKAADPALARAWRAAARAALEHYLARGWRVTDVVRPEARVSGYLLERG